MSRGHVLVGKLAWVGREYIPTEVGVSFQNQSDCYLIAKPGLYRRLRGRWTSTSGGRKVIFGTTSPRTEDLVFLTERIEAGKLKTVIDRYYSLEQIALAHFLAPLFYLSRYPSSFETEH